MKNLLLAFAFLICAVFTSQSQSLQQIGINQFNQSKFEAAAVTFKKILEKDTKNPIALEYLGDIAFAEKKWDAATKYFKSLLKTDNQKANYHFKYGGALGMKARENKLKALFLIDDIKEHLIKAAELDPKHLDTRFALVNLFLELPSPLGGSVKKAQFYANELSALNPQIGAKANALISKLQ